MQAPLIHVARVDDGLLGQELEARQQPQLRGGQRHVPQRAVALEPGTTLLQGLGQLKIFFWPEGLHLLLNRQQIGHQELGANLPNDVHWVHRLRAEAVQHLQQHLRIPSAGQEHRRGRGLVRRPGGEPHPGGHLLPCPHHGVDGVEPGVGDVAEPHLGGGAVPLGEHGEEGGLPGPGRPNQSAAADRQPRAGRAPHACHNAAFL
mmetsp:Transcript_38696/g.69269  ORF Transcript_38696/g.69269 Transcript_38696/m.69269 type:complete len:204 (+) Transcript_38696:429-1040(+)